MMSHGHGRFRNKQSSLQFRLAYDARRVSLSNLHLPLSVFHPLVRHSSHSNLLHEGQMGSISTMTDLPEGISAMDATILQAVC